MAKVLKFIDWFTQTFQFSPELFDTAPGPLRLYRQPPSMPSLEEAWRQDWENIGMAFRRAAVRLDRELAR